MMILKVLRKRMTLLLNELVNRKSLLRDGAHKRIDIASKEAWTSDQLIVPVIMCCWSRIDLLPRTLASLSEQAGVIVELHIWNNNRNYRQALEQIVREAGPKVRVSIYQSEVNIGGYGRFYVARSLGQEEHNYAITIDDDQEFGPQFIAGLYGEREEKTIKGDFAFRFKTQQDYWAKELVKSGEEADYCGTGGAIFDLSLFQKKDLFKCPKRYWFIEDLWACMIAKKYDWTIMRSHAKVKFMVIDGKDQHSKMYKLKNYFLDYLRQCKYIER